MRKTFFGEFTKTDAWLLYNDVGYLIIDQSHPRVRNCGIAEQAMIGMAAGMASCGAKVYCYSIAPHLIRAWEFVRNLVVYPRRNVVLVGVGIEDDYAALGFTHAVTEREMAGLCDAIGLVYERPLLKSVLLRAMRREAPLFIHLSKRGFE